MMGLEPTTSCLQSRRSTCLELHPHECRTRRRDRIRPTAKWACRVLIPASRGVPDLSKVTDLNQFSTVRQVRIELTVLSLLVYSLCGHLDASAGCGTVGTHPKVARPIDGLFSATGCVRYRCYRLLPARPPFKGDHRVISPAHSSVQSTCLVSEVLPDAAHEWKESNPHQRVWKPLS